MKLVTNNTLKQLFPKYAKEIDAISGGYATCGCSVCTLRILKNKYPKETFEIPKKYELVAWG